MIDENLLASAVRNACDRMGVTLVRSEHRPGIGAWISFNQRQALNPMTRSVWLDSREEHTEAWFWALHELEHLVFWREDDPQMRSSPELLFMPWGVGVLRAAGVPGAEYMRSTYNRATVTGIGALWIGKRCYGEVGDWAYPMKSAWFRRARAANIAAGTIDERGLPTWRMPDWSKIDIEEHLQP